VVAFPILTQDVFRCVNFIFFISCLALPQDLPSIRNVVMLNGRRGEESALNVLYINFLAAELKEDKLKHWGQTGGEVEMCMCVKD
jgi:hypothetical protein